MSNCVNKSSKEFKDCCKRLNVSPTTLEPIIHEFINIEGNENSFPSDVYIEERIHGKSTEVLEESQVQLWEMKYSQTKTFNTKEEALNYYNECNKFFPKDSIGFKETLDSKYEIRVAKITNNKELEEIKNKAVADDTFMKAPNGKPTNLTEDQWLHVRTKAFKRWFGDWENDLENASKVVDENGEPLVVYHGSKSIIDTFDSSKGGNTRQYLSKTIKDTNFFSKDKSVADFFAVTEKQSIAASISRTISMALEAGEEDSNIIWNAVARNIKKSVEWTKNFWENEVPSEYKLNDEYGYSKMKDLDVEKQKYAVFINARNPLILNAKGERADTFIENNVDLLNSNDEVIIYNIDETVGTGVTTDFLIRNSNNIKSATDNIGTYSKDTNIYLNTSVNPYSIPSKKNKFLVLSEKTSESFTNWISKAHGKYPKEFQDANKPYIYRKSNNNKRSRKYDVIDVNTGEVIAKNTVLYTQEEYNRLLETRKLFESDYKQYHEKKSLAYKKGLMVPSEGLFKRMAKQYLLEAIYASSDITEHTLNTQIIDEFINKFDESFWEHVVTFLLEPSIYVDENGKPSKYEDGLMGLATNDLETFNTRFAFNTTIPKHGLIDQLEKTLNIKINGKKIKTFINGNLEEVTISRDLDYKTLKIVLKEFVKKEFPLSKEESIRAYAKEHNLSIEEVNNYIEQQREYADIASSKNIEKITTFNPKVNEIYNIINDYNEKYKDYLKEKGITIPNNLVHIIFNRDSYAGEDTPLIRLATILHEPYHALSILFKDSEALNNVLNAFQVFKNTEYGKQVFEKYIEYNKQYKDEVVQEEFLADLFSFFMMPQALRDDYGLLENKEGFLGPELFKMLNNILNKPATITYLKSKEVSFTKEIEETYTEEEKITLSLIKRIYNAIIEWLSKYSDLVKKTFKLYEDTKLVQKTRKVKITESTTITEEITELDENLKDFREALSELSTTMELLMSSKVFSKGEKPLTKASYSNISQNLVGENIYSKGSDFAKQLTNPGNTVSVTYKGKTFINAEHAYQTWKSGEFDEKTYKSTSLYPKGTKPVNKDTNFQTMVEIITAKLQQHPELIEGINERGGLEYLLNSTHKVKGDPYWESSGQNKFIEALVEAYNNTLNVSKNNIETQEEDLTQDEIDTKANKEAELDAVFQNTLQLTEQLKNIQDSGLISTSEFTQLANDVAYYISDLITRWQENPEEFKQSAPTLAAEIDVRTLSRRELVEKIGVPKLLEVVKKALFGKRIPGVDARKTLLLFKNFDALIRFGSSAFNTVEDFQISYSEIGYTVSDKVESTENENLSNEENAVIEENGDKQEHWQIDSRTVDTFLTMSQAVKKELARCYKLNADGSIKQNEFGINERISPRDATSCILRWTQGALSLSDMITKLEAKQENNPWIEPIIKKLKDTSGKYSDFQSQFFGVFCKHFQEYYIVKEFNEGGNRVLRIMPVNRTPALNEIMTSIEVLFKLKAHPMFDNKGLIKEKLDDLKSYVNLLNEISTGNFEELSLDRISKGIAKIADLLGYKTTDEMVILALTPESLYNIKKALSYIVSNLEKGLGDSNYNPFSFNKENKNGIRNNLKDFLQPLTEVLEDLAISSFFESGKMYQSYVIPSYMTKLMRKFQNSNEQEFKEFMQKEYGQYEWFRDQSRDIEDPNSWKNDWLRQLYFMSNENRKKLFGHKVQLSFIGHNYMRNMTGPEYVMAIMTEFFSGSKDSKETIVPTWYKIPMMSNKPSLEFIKFARYRGVGWDETILDGLDMVFIQELGRIIEVRNRAYDKKDDRHIKNFDVKGRKFCFLDFLNDYLDGGSKAHTELGNLLNRKIESSNKTSTVEKLNIEEENRLSDLIRQEIRDFMNKTSDRIIQSYKDSGLFEAAKKIDGIGNTDAEVEANIRNFIWNDTYASMMILQMTITDTAYYANAEDLQKRLAQIHAPGIRPNVEAMDYGEYDEVGRTIRKARRVCDGSLRTIFLKDFEGDAVIQNVIENLEIVFDRKYNEAKTDAERDYWKATKESIIDAFKQVNVTDAQAYNSITSYRKKAIMFGKWSPKNEEVYKKLKNGEWNISDLETIFQPLKPFVYTNSTKTSVGSKIKVGMQFKNAEYALLIADAILRNEDTGKPNLLRVLSEVMEKSADRTENKDKGIDTIMFASAVKAGLHGRLDIANFASEEAAKNYLESKIYGDGADGYNETYVHTFPAEDYSIQQDYSPHFLEHSQADGSQKRMIIPSDLAIEDADGNPVLYTFKDGDEIKSLTAKEFKKEYEETYAENIENSLNELAFELGLNLPTKKLRNIALSQVLQKEILSSPRYGIDLYIACSVDSEGNFNIPLGDPIQSKRIEQLINSIVKNRLNKQKIKGGPVVQVSNFGSKRLHIRFKDKNGNILPTLTEWLEKNPGKTAEDFKKFLEDNQAGVAHYECYAPASMREIFECFMDENGFVDWEAINEIEPEMLEMLGFRIPTEDLYSIAPLKIMGFLPKEAGEALMLPYEITVIWGADYDWDKAYLQRKEFIIKMNSRRDIEDSFISKFGNKNKEDIKMFLDQAYDPKTRMQAYGTYPEYAKFYRRVAFSIDKPTKGKAYRNNKIIDMSLAVLTHETSAHRMLNPGGFEPQKRMGYLVSAVILGKGTYEQLSKLSTDKLKELCMTDKNLSFIDVNTQFYEQNNAAGSILGMFAVQKIAHATLENNGLYLEVNKALQLAKNTPFVFCGKSFYGLVEFDPTLNSKGEYIGKVLGSLVASAADAVKDPVLNLMNINSTTANVLTTMIRFGIPFEQAALLTSQKIIGDCLKEFNVRNLDGYVNFATIIEEKLIALRDNTGITEGDDVNTEELTEKELIEGLVSDNPKIQYKALLAFSNFMTMANELKGPTFATRFNSISNAVGPQIIDNLIMANKMNQFSSNIRRKVGDNIVEININDIFNMHPILQQFAKGLETANKLFGGHMPLLSQDFQALLNSLPEGIESKIYGDRKLLSKLADFYLSYLLINSGCIDTTTSKGLDYYINKFPKEFFETKIKEKYPDNPFIQAIMVETTKTPDGGERFILKLETTGMETTDKEKLSAGWEDLAKEDFNLCMKLFKYCFYKGGIGFTPKTFMHLLPNSIKKEIPKYIESFKAQRVLHPEYVVDQFIRNNWQNNKLVPKIQDAEDFVEFNENISLGIVDNNYHSLFRGLNYCRIKINGKDVLFKINKFKNEADQWIVQLVKTTPLGNNGEYLEISKSNIEKTMDNTEIAIDDNTPDFPNAMPDVVENIKVSKTDKEKQYYLDLIARVITQDKVAEFKAKSSDEQQSFKPGMKKFFTKAFAKQGIEFNMEEFDKLFETFCS